MTDYKFSIVIPTYARTDLLQDAISSVLNQSYKNYEVIVVDDNGNESPFRELTEKFMNQYKEVKQIKLVQHEKNMGGCAARNTGIRCAEGDLIAFLDDDDRWKDDYLEKMVAKFEKKEIGVVYCNNDTLADGKIYEGHRERWLKGNVRQQIIGGWCPSSTSLVVVRKECFDNVGGFDEALKSFQDYDMWLRLSEVYEFDYVQENLIVKLENHGEQVSMNPYKRLDGMEYLKKKWIGSFGEKERQHFDEFLKIEEQQLRKKFILYNRRNHIKCNYLKLYLDYCKTSAKLSNKILIIFIIAFGVEPLKIFDKLRNKGYTRI